MMHTSDERSTSSQAAREAVWSEFFHPQLGTIDAGRIIEALCETRAKLSAVEEEKAQALSGWGTSLKQWERTNNVNASLRKQIAADAQRVCSGCDAPRLKAIYAVIEGRVACCPDCSTLTVEERNAIRNAVQLKRESATPLIEAALAMAKAIEERRPWVAENTLVREARRYIGTMTQPPRVEEVPYGRCPICGGVGQFRERRLDGNDRCVHGHVYPSRDAVMRVATPEVL